MNALSLHHWSQYACFATKVQDLKYLGHRRSISTVSAIISRYVRMRSHIARNRDENELSLEEYVKENEVSVDTGGGRICRLENRGLGSTP